MDVKEMNTQEAIEFINMVVDGIEKIAFCPTTKIMEPIKKDAKKVVSLLQQGEKYRQMWGELYFKYGEVFLNDYRSPEILLEERMEDIEQKYFPKPKEREEVLILTIKGKPHEVDNVIFNIEHAFRNSAHVDVKWGTRAENVQES